VPLAPGQTQFTHDDVMAEVAQEDSGRVRTPVGAISIETPVRRRRGEVVDFTEMTRIAGFARERGIGLHLDGARLFLATPYTGVAPSVWAAPFDTVYVSLYKYFNAAGGAVLAGPRHLLDGLYHQRRMFGGGLRQAWPYAAVALHYLDGFADRFVEAVAIADQLFRALAKDPRVELGRTPASTNVTRLHLKGADAAEVRERLARCGITIRPPLAACDQGAEFELIVNETLRRRPAAQTIGDFLAAITAC
jgi:threonine aldolase